MTLHTTYGTLTIVEPFIYISNCTAILRSSSFHTLRQLYTYAFVWKESHIPAIPIVWPPRRCFFCHLHDPSVLNNDWSVGLTFPLLLLFYVLLKRSEDVLSEDKSCCFCIIPCHFCYIYIYDVQTTVTEAQAGYVIDWHSHLFLGSTGCAVCVFHFVSIFLARPPALWCHFITRL